MTDPVQLRTPPKSRPPTRLAWRTGDRSASRGATSAASRPGGAWRARSVLARAGRRTVATPTSFFELATPRDPTGPSIPPIDAIGVRVSASSPAGLAHGASTLAQWLRRELPRRRRVPGRRTSQTSPIVAIRGFQLDVSRNRVPTMAELERLVERLASLKFNQLQLYLEHAFAYAGHEVVWRGFDPADAGRDPTLASWCAERHIELVPNQNSFGHLHRWLVHEPYRQLAECPDGIAHPFSPDRSRSASARSTRGASTPARPLRPAAAVLSGG